MQILTPRRNESSGARDPTASTWPMATARHRPGRRIDTLLDNVLPAFDADGRHATVVVDWSAAVDDPSRQVELRLALTSALEELPAHYRAVLVMRDVHGCPSAEIAEALHVSVGGVKTRVHRARLFIRKRLAESLDSCSVVPVVESARTVRER
jgi:RNA polymerase sigma factor (sigma-70 family)